MVLSDQQLCNRLGQFVSKFENGNYTVCGKLILPKKEKAFKKKKFATTGLQICMDLRIFASFLYPGVQPYHVFKTVQKCKKSLKTVKILKMMVIFEFLTLKLV